MSIISSCNNNLENITTDRFTQIFQLNTPIYELLKKNKITIKSPINVTEVLLDKFCSIYNEQLILDYRIFKCIAKPSTYSIIINHIVKNINKILLTNQLFSDYIYSKSLTITAADKYIQFIYKLTETLTTTYPDKLDKCYIYEAPFVFQQIIGMLSMFIDKKTLSKIQLV